MRNHKMLAIRLLGITLAGLLILGKSMMIEFWWIVIPLPGLLFHIGASLIYKYQGRFGQTILLLIGVVVPGEITHRLILSNMQEGHPHYMATKLLAATLLSVGYLLMTYIVILMVAWIIKNWNNLT